MQGVDEGHYSFKKGNQEEEKKVGSENKCEGEYSV